MKFTLKNENNTVIINSHGGELSSFQHNDIEYIHQPSPKTWNRSAPYLFPNVGALKNNTAIINNQLYNLTKHGFLRDQELNLVEQSENFLVLKATETAETLNIYPYKFEFILSYFLEKDTLKCNIEIKNMNNEPMYFNLGLHPAFRVPLYENEKFEDYEIIFTTPITAQLPTVNLKTGLVDYNNVAREVIDLQKLSLDYNDYSNDALIFDPFNDNSVILEHKITKHGIKFEFNNFKTLGIWTPNHIKADFICLEPWIGCADSPLTTSFESKKDIIKLQNFSSWSTSYSITVK